MFPAHFIEECQWEGPYKDRYISGNDQKTLTGIEDIKTCKEACEAEKSFDCMSFDFLKTHKYCYLQRVNLYKNKLSVSTSYEFYERNCFSKYIFCDMLVCFLVQSGCNIIKHPHHFFIDKFRTCSADSPVTWSQKKAGYYLAGNDLRSLASKTVEQCKEACMQSRDYHCLSIDYRRKDSYCFLQGAST